MTKLEHEKRYGLYALFFTGGKQWFVFIKENPLRRKIGIFNFNMIDNN
jgi:hypothetical protein